MAQIRDGTVRTDTGRNVPEELRQNLPDARAHLTDWQISGHQTDAAVDIVSHTSGGDDTVFGVHCRHAADGEAVAPVNIRHGEGIVYDAGKVSDVPHLVNARIAFDVLYKFAAGVDPPRYQHPAGLGNLPDVVRNLL